MSVNKHGCIRASRKNPCRICGGHKNCWEGQYVAACSRVPIQGQEPDKGGLWHHRIDSANVDRSADHHVVRFPSRPGSRARCAPWESRLDTFKILEPDPHHGELASQLGVSVESIRRLDVAWHPQRFWTIPERDASGQVIGISKRSATGEKKCLPGSQRGLIFAHDWDTGGGPIVIPEGMSDLLAAMTLALSGIARPSNLGGVDLLIDLLANVPADREIIVIGERDQKPDGKWPGRDGMITTATRLSEALGRPIGMAFPPGGAKDLRKWLNCTPNPTKEAFLSGMERVQTEPEKPAPREHSGRGIDPRFIFDDHCSYCVLLRPNNSGPLFHAKLDCDGWRCTNCSKKLRKKWTKHIVAKFEEHANASQDATPTIYRGVIATGPKNKNWKRISTAIYRAGGHKLRITLEDGCFAIYATVPFEGSQGRTVYCATQEFTADLAAAAELGVKPIFVSRGWRLPPREEAKNSIVATMSYYHVPSFREAAAKFKAKIETVNAEDRDKVEALTEISFVVGSDDWDEERDKAYVAECNRQFVAFMERKRRLSSQSYSNRGSAIYGHSDTVTGGTGARAQSRPPPTLFPLAQ